MCSALPIRWELLWKTRNPLAFSMKNDRMFHRKCFPWIYVTHGKLSSDGGTPLALVPLNLGQKLHRHAENPGRQMVERKK